MSKDEQIRTYDHLDATLTEFIQNSGYYKSNLHARHCKICKLPPIIKNKVNQMILDNEDLRTIQTYLLDQFPDVFDSENRNRRNLKRCIEAHTEYLPHLLEDVMIKSIFNRARSLLENKNLATMTNVEKAEVISKIEEEIIKEYEDIEQERISLVNVLFKDTIPMMLTRLHHEILEGTTKNLKEITESANVIWKMTTAMASVNSQVKEEESEIDYSKFNNGSTSNQIISLADKIKSATGDR